MSKEEQIEKVESFKYLRYILCENINDNKHVKTQVEKVNAPG